MQGNCVLVCVSVSGFQREVHPQQENSENLIRKVWVRWRSVETGVGWAISMPDPKEWDAGRKERLRNLQGARDTQRASKGAATCTRGNTACGSPAGAEPKPSPPPPQLGNPTNRAPSWGPEGMESCWCCPQAAFPRGRRRWGSGQRPGRRTWVQARSSHPPPASPQGLQPCGLPASCLVSSLPLRSLKEC